MRTLQRPTSLWLMIVLIGGLLTQARPAAAQPAHICDESPGIYLYEGLNYSGRCLRVGADVPDLRPFGFNDIASSVRVVGPWSATLYAGLQYGGSSSTFTIDDENLIDNAVRNDRVSSIRAQPLPTPIEYVCDGSEGVYLYDLPNYGGRCLRFRGDIDNLQGLGFDDSAASVAFIGEWTASLFDGEGFGSTTATFTANTSDLDATPLGNDRLSSLRVQRGRVEPALVCDGGEGVYLYAEPGYRGRCLKVTADLRDLGAYSFDDLASSVRVVGAYVATLYRDPVFANISAEVVGDDPDFADDPIGVRTTSSIRVRAAAVASGTVCNGRPGVYLYEEPGYLGRCLKVTANARDLRIYGFDDSVSSVRIVGDYAATLYRDLAFTGIASPIAGAEISLADNAIGDEQLTSVQVHLSGIPATLRCEGEGVYLYQDPQFQGPCRKFIANIHDLRLFDFDEAVSSVRIVGPYSAQLHADLAFRGPWTGFRRDDPDLADDIVGDNRASSVQVQRR